MKATEYKWVGTHAQDLPGGRTLAVGESVILDDAATQHVIVDDLINSGTLISVGKPAGSGKTEGKE